MEIALDKELEKLRKENLLLKKKIELLEMDMIHDRLTGLKTRAFFDEELGRNLDLMFSKGNDLRKENFGFTQMSLLFIDADNFKSINDNYGHSAGDSVLKEIGKVLNGNIRKTDIAARYGGEEMAVILLGADEETAYKKAEEIRSGIKNISLKKHLEIKVTVSIGVSEAKNIISGEIIKEADMAMYRAKHTGKDKTVKFSNLNA